MQAETHNGSLEMKHNGIYQNVRRKVVGRVNHSRPWIKWIAIVLLVIYLFNITILQSKVRHDMQTILLWNSDLPDRPILTKWMPYIECGCVITTNRQYKKHDINAIVFNADNPFDFQGLEMTPRSEKYFAVYAALRPFDELPVPPTYGKVAPYNLTMTYRLDSNILWRPYFITKKNSQEVPKKFEAVNAVALEELSMSELCSLKKTMNIKSRMVVYNIFPVNGFTRTKSLMLNELRQYMDLDAYATCSGGVCRSYKFILIFETSHIGDYINPEFFAALKRRIVPVVFSNADYSRFAPPHSYINVKDYQNIQELANYLIHLNGNTHGYFQYFYWHARYTVRRNQKPYCKLCQAIHNPSVVQKYSNDGKDFLSWWSKGYSST